MEIVAAILIFGVGLLLARSWLGEKYMLAAVPLSIAFGGVWPLLFQHVFGRLDGRMFLGVYLFVFMALVWLNRDLRFEELRVEAQSVRFWKNRWLMIPVILILLLCVYHSVFFPPAVSDELYYHMGIPRYAFSAGEFPPYYYELPRAPANVFMLDSLFFTSVMYLADSAVTPIVRLTPVLAALSCLFLLAQLGRKLFDGRIAELSVLFVISSPLFISHAHILFSHMMASMFWLASIHYLLEPEVKKRLWLSAVMLGFAMWLSNFIFVPAALLFLLFERRDFRTICRYLAIFAIVASPLFLRAFVLTGDPIFPFGSPQIRTTEEIWANNKLIWPNDNINSLKEFVLLPYLLLFVDFENPANPALNVSKGFGPLLAVFGLLGLLLLVKRKKKEVPAVIGISLFVWFVTAGGITMRYTFSICFFLAMAGAYAFRDLWEGSKTIQRRVLTAILLLCLLVPAMMVAAIGAKGFGGYVLSHKWMPPASDDEAYMVTHPQYLLMSREVNANAERVLVLPSANTALYFIRPDNIYVYNVEEYKYLKNRGLGMEFLKKRNLRYVLFQDKNDVVDVKNIESYVKRSKTWESRSNNLTLWEV